MKPASPPILVIVGPTAVGKSACAMEAASRFGGEILSVDSMQVYRGLDAATSKPSQEDRRRVPHHGLDLAEPGDDFSMGDFVRAAEAAVEDVAARVRLPILVGGTGLYLRAFLRGMAEAPHRVPSLRARLNRIAVRRGAPYLHRMLQRLDPRSAARLPERDRQRLVRALEVRFTARRALSDLIEAEPFGADRFPAVKLGLTMERRRLYERIDARADGFFARGLLEETRGLLARGVRRDANAFKAIGSREALAHLDGTMTLDEARAETRLRTRRYAKRQWTWFRNEPGVTWFEIDPDAAAPFAAPLDFAAAELGRLFGGGPWA
ncbi:MAG TPA: tRNA (adenosine(37)-N6)-dimethylallyltransferase MiaA [Verrucomicrobiae bacterium]|nr:tRNA (adenosine(37)-N6)-dimethylallyltransferase MiaA [Verrucomicrobiae bacterium]